MKICATSDLHGNLPDIPECEILFICGDIAPDFNFMASPQIEWVSNKFIPWVENVKAKSVVAIPGNHDFGIERAGVLSFCNDKLKMLDNTIIELNGLKIYGIPQVPLLDSWAYYASDPTLYLLSSNAPKDVDILLLHAPPHGISDTCLQWGMKEHLGCRQWRSVLFKQKPKYCFFGHIHSGDHRLRAISEAGNLIRCYNISLLNEDYEIEYPVLELDI